MFKDSEVAYEHIPYSVDSVALGNGIVYSAKHPVIQLIVAMINVCKRQEAESSGFNYLQAKDLLSIETVGHIIQFLQHTEVDLDLLQDVFSWNPQRVNMRSPARYTAEILHSSSLPKDFIQWPEVERFAYTVTSQPRNMGSWVFQAMMAINSMFRLDDFDWLRPRVMPEVTDIMTLRELASIRRAGHRSAWRSRTELDIPQGLSIEVAYLYLGMVEPHSRDILRRLVSLPRPGIIGHGIISHYLYGFISETRSIREVSPKLVDLLSYYIPH
jgi:hypothetical protein